MKLNDWLLNLVGHCGITIQKLWQMAVCPKVSSIRMLECLRRNSEGSCPKKWNTVHTNQHLPGRMHLTTNLQECTNSAESWGALFKNEQGSSVTRWAQKPVYKWGEIIPINRVKKVIYRGYSSIYNWFLGPPWRAFSTKSWRADPLFFGGEEVSGMLADLDTRWMYFPLDLRTLKPWRFSSFLSFKKKIIHFFVQSPN